MSISSSIRSKLPRSVRRLVRRLIYGPAPADYISRLTKGKKIFFVQIGSNDGLNGDPLQRLIAHNESWHGILVEPVPYLFDRLVKNHASRSKRLIFENIAISNVDSSLPFYYVLPEAKNYLPDLPTWYDQLGSFDRNHILKHLDGVLEPYIRDKKVQTTSLTSLLRRHKVDQLDLLHIDVEGHDYKVLSSLDFETIAPSIILYESGHLDENDAKLANDMLVRYGYNITVLGFDTLAVLSRSRL